MRILSHQSRRSNAEYWYKRRQIKKANVARKERGNPVQSGGFRPDYMESRKFQRMKERYRDNLRGAKR